MAYTIGSSKGKEIAKNMTVGSTYKASDGSTWKKNSDGSVSVTHQGVTTNNAYTPTTSSGSSGSSSSGSSGGSYSGGSSSGSSYNKSTINSQYTSGQWDANTDYQAIINAAKSAGDYTTAAQAEYLRNQKINSTGSNYATTNNYSGWLTGDLGLSGQQLMDSGADWRDVREIYEARRKKAMKTEGLGQYADDPLQDAMWDYILKGMDAEYENGEFEYDEEAPEYNNKYDPAMEQLLNEILNREDFSYNAQTDPLYQQYEAMYKQEGNRAMQETMANAAASAGGMNSYAITAAQQANNYYASQMANKIPELYQLAYEMYLQDKESKVQDLGLLQGMDSTLYNRYRDAMSDYYADRNFAYGKYRDDVTQNNWEKEFAYNQTINDRNFNYGVSQDAIDQSWKEKEWNNNMSQQELANNRYDQENAKNEAYALLELGQMPPSDLLKAAGIDEAYASAYLAGVKAQQAKVSGGDDVDYTGYKKIEEDDKPEENEDDTGYTGTESNATSKDATQHKNYNDGSVAGLGIGMINNDTLEQLIKIGGVVGDEDGNFYWADGWSANNYQERMKSLNGIGYLFTH